MADKPRLAGTPIGTYVEVRDGGKAHIRGVDYGPKLEFHAESRTALVLKVGGHNAWSGRGQTSYFPTRFLVFKIKERSEQEGQVSYFVEPVVEFCPKKGAEA